MTKQEYRDIYDIVGAAQEVHKTLGRGLSEPIYQEALALEMKERDMAFEREKELRLYYKEHLMDKTYFVDFFYKGVMIELKAVEKISSEHRSQLFNYMRITQQDRGVLLNFCEKSLRAERYLYLPETDSFVLLTQDNYKDYIDE
jgi:GxxExxY protein